MPWAVSCNEAKPPRFKFLNAQVLEALAKSQPVGQLAVTTETFPLYALECLWAVIDEKLEPDIFPSAVTAAGVPGPHSVAVSHVFWLVWADIEGPNADAFTDELNASDLPLGSSQASRVVAALQEARRSQLVEDIDLFEVLDLRLLVQSGLSTAYKHPSSFAKKMLLTYNNRSMKISLFNTFREELAGFSKLTTLLNNPALLHAHQIPSICTEIDQLTGYYRLSPAKVCTCIIVAMERGHKVASVRFSILVSTSRIYILIQLPHLLPSWCLDAVKRRLAHGGTPGAGGLSQSFFMIIAVLLRNSKLTLVDVLKLLAGSFDGLPSSEAEIKNLAEQMRGASVHGGQVASLYGEHMNLDVSVRDTVLTKSLPDSPPFKLAQALLSHGSWEHAQTILKHTKFPLLIHRKVCLALLKRLAAALEDRYGSGLPQHVTPLLPMSKKPSDANSQPLTTEILQLLEAAGVFIFRRPDVLVILWRVARGILVSEDRIDTEKEDAIFAVRHCILPASCVLPANGEVWLLAQECLQVLPQLKRCNLYYDVAVFFRLSPLDPISQRVIPPPSLLHELLLDHSNHIGRILSTFAKKSRLPDGTVERSEEARDVGRVIQKAMLSHPFGAANKTVELCRMYDSNCELFLYYCSSLLPIVQEIIMFEALRFMLCTSKSRLGPDKAAPDDWLNNIVKFIGRLAAQNSHLDVYVVFGYLCQNLRDKENQHPLDVILAGAVFENMLSAPPWLLCVSPGCTHSPLWGQLSA